MRGLIHKICTLEVIVFKRELGTIWVAWEKCSYSIANIGRIDMK